MNSKEPQATDDRFDGLPEAPADGTTAPDEERRRALRRLGPLAVLTPPTVMSLLVSKRASASSPSPPGDPIPEDRRPSWW